MPATEVQIRIKKVFRYFEDNRSTSPERAIPFSDVPYSNKWYVKRLVDKGIIKTFGDKVYLDLEDKNAYIKRRRLFAIGLIALAAIILLMHYFYK